MSRLTAKDRVVWSGVRWTTPWFLDRYDGYSRWERHYRVGRVVVAVYGPTVPERGCKPGDS